jgi:hypothetical protein
MELRGNLLTMAALVARSRRRTLFAIQGFGDDARRRGLADAAHPGKKIGVSDALGSNRVLESPRDVTLPGDVFKTLRAPFAC